MKIGVIIAMDKEFRRMEELLGHRAGAVANGRHYVTGTMGRCEVVLHQCGIGKVNAAVGATELISAFAPSAVVSTGVAGGASEQLEVMDVVAARQTCYHDVYCGSEVAYGQVQGMPARYEADPVLLAKAEAIGCGVRLHTGLTVTGDWFVDSQDKMRSIIDRFPDATAVDMESAAIAQACHLRRVPFLSLRVISDIPLSDRQARQYSDFWGTMADNSFRVTRTFIESL